MEKSAYKNRKKEINELIELILENKKQIILYNSCAGYGNTAFIGRCQYILHKTQYLQLFYAELSDHETSPLHIVTKSINTNKEKLYQQMQFYTDEAFGTSNVPIVSSLIKDITQSDTLAALFESRSAIPIYTGFYQDRLKEIFFKLIDHITKEKRVIFFIDNIQFMDQESVYELNALLQNPKVTLVIFKTGEGLDFDKFYYEIKYNFAEIEIPFPEPDVKYIKELSDLYNMKLSSTEADLLLYKSHKNIRKILYFLREGNIEKSLDDFEFQLLKIIYMYDDYISEKKLLQICDYGPYSGVYSKEIVSNILSKLEMNNYISSIILFESKEKKYKLLSDYRPQVDIADKLIISKSLLIYYNTEENLDYKHLNHAWQISNQLGDIIKLKWYSLKIIRSALSFGFKVNNDIIEVAQEIEDYNSQLLVATFLFSNANYRQAKTILMKYIDNNSNRSIEIMYAIILNRCRDHSSAEIKLNSLIQTSRNIDELTILITFLISNSVHSNKVTDAKKLFYKYRKKLESSIKYPYFLRNAATIFEENKAYELRYKAKLLFKKNNDLYGYYSTIVNMASYLVFKTSRKYAISQLLMAFEGLQQYNASQIHLVANNLGLCYLLDNNYLQAIKYFELALESAKTIMPITYTTINLSGMYLNLGNYEKAYAVIHNLYEDVATSKIPRLKGRFYLHIAIVEYVQGNFQQSNNACINAREYASAVAGNQIRNVTDKLTYYMNKDIAYSDDLCAELFIPCFLEYWIINSIDILDINILST